MIDALENVKDLFDAELQTAANTEATTRSKTIENIKEILTAWKKNIVQYPTILISPLNTDRLDDNDPIYVYSKEHKIAVAIVYKNANLIDLQNNILIYSKAVEKLIAKNPHLGNPPAVNRAKWDGVDYSDIVDMQKGGEVLQMAIVGLSIEPIAESDELGNIPNA